jgi:hypothetical protein
MSETPTFASLLTQWATGGSAARSGVYAHLREHPAEAAAVETSIRAELNTGSPWKRVLAAEALVEVYVDEPAAAEALRSVFRLGDEAVACDAASVLKKLAPERAAPLLADFAVHTPTAFRRQPANFHRWAASTAIRSGAGGAGRWLLLLGRPGVPESAYFMGLADGAPHTHDDLTTVESLVRSRLFESGPGYAAGGALWRITWRINRDWLASINPDSPRFETDRPLLVLLIEVLTEHLGRRPDLAALVRALLVRLGNDDVVLFGPVLKRIADLGGRGWSVLLPALGDAGIPAHTRAHVFNEAAKRPAVLPLAHHHAHGLILARGQDCGAVPQELLESAAGVLRAIGAPAGAALPDLLDLMVKQRETARFLAPAVSALAPGWPVPAAALARALDRMRRSTEFVPDSFTTLAEVFAARHLDAAPALVEDTSFDPRTADLLLQQPAWREASADVRARHARVLADRLAAPRPEVRVRAAELLRHYPDQMSVVWPALVAVLACDDEKAVLLALPLFRHLGPVADAVTAELMTLFREPNPIYAARAVVALWRLGRMPVVADELRAAVVGGGEDAWGWAVLRGVLDRVLQAHGLLHDLTNIFAAAPQDVAAKIHALLNPPEEAEEAAISTHVRTEQRPRVAWDGLYQCVGDDPDGGLLFLALMCAHGSGGFANQKLWMIKHQRTLTGSGLADAKGIVERAINQLTTTATTGDRLASVRDFFGYSPGGPPKALTDLLEHRLSWYRWAGLELLDAWGEPAAVPTLIADRLWDRSARVRTRALRMFRG